MAHSNTRGKFVLVQHTRMADQYYRESGIVHAGTENEQKYLYWTWRRDEAYHFPTLKQARMMCEKLFYDFGVPADILAPDNKVVW